MTPTRVGAMLLVAACCAGFARPAAAGVLVTFANGRVTIVATDATVREILAEWSRVGGSTFIDAEKIPSTERLTLRLEDQRELDALDVLLRSVAGYMVAPIEAAPSRVSAVDRVFILPTSTPAPYTPPPAALATQAFDAFDSAPRMTAGPPSPDDDGPARISAPPSPVPVAPTAAAPLGQSSPLLNNTPSQNVPGLGVVTSSQPGVVIGVPAPGRGRPRTQPNQPVRPGGGGERR